MEQHPLYPEGIHSWQQHYRSDQADSEEPEAGGSDLQTLRWCSWIHKEVQPVCTGEMLQTCSLAAERTTYTYIKNTIGAVAEELDAEGYITDKNKKRNEGSYIMDSSYSDMEKLLNRSRTLADKSGKEAQR